MSTSTSTSLVALLLLGGVGLAACDHSAGAAGAAEDGVEDRYMLRYEVESLVQTGLETSRWGRLQSFNTTQIGFPLYFGDFHFVASVAVSLSYAGIKVQAYDLALYLRSDSRLWGNATKNSKRAMEIIQSMVGNVQFHMHFSSKFVTRGALAGFVDKLEPYCEKAHVPNMTKVLEDYKSRILHGPKVTMGSSMIIEPRTDGIHLLMNNQDLGTVVSAKLSDVTVSGYFGPETTLPMFRDQVFTQLEHGLFDSATVEPVKELVEVHSSWRHWLILALVVVGTAVTTCLLAWYCCCRRRAPAKAPLSASAGRPQ